MENASENQLPAEMSHESPEQTLSRYLNTLQLTQEDLRGKQIMDLGCGDGNFAVGVYDAQIQANVVSLDSFRKPTSNPEFVSRNLKFILDDATGNEDVVDGITYMKEGSFDLVVSVSALPVTAHMNKVEIENATISYHDYFDLDPTQQTEYCRQTKELTRKCIRESLRIVKPGGEIRFGGNIHKKLPEQSPYLLVDEAIKQGVLEALEGNGQLVKEAIREESGLWIIKKNENKSGIIIP